MRALRVLATWCARVKCGPPHGCNDLVLSNFPCDLAVGDWQGPGSSKGRGLQGATASGSQPAGSLPPGVGGGGGATHGTTYGYGTSYGYGAVGGALPGPGPLGAFPSLSAQPPPPRWSLGGSGVAGQGGGSASGVVSVAASPALSPTTVASLSLASQASRGPSPPAPLHTASSRGVVRGVGLRSLSPAASGVAGGPGVGSGATHGDGGA